MLNEACRNDLKLATIHTYQIRRESQSPMMRAPLIGVVLWGVAALGLPVKMAGADKTTIPGVDAPEAVSLNSAEKTRFMAFAAEAITEMADACSTEAFTFSVTDLTAATQSVEGPTTEALKITRACAGIESWAVPCPIVCLLLSL